MSEERIIMTRSGLIAEIVKRRTAPESWTVEAIAMKDDGAIEIAIFSGPKAKERAVEYAAAKYTDYRVLADAA
jgi:hypothetical protein